METFNYRNTTPVTVAPTSAAPTKEAFDALRRDVERLKRQVAELSNRLEEAHPHRTLTGL